MARFLVFVLFAGGAGTSLYLTKPTRADYLHRLEARSRVVSGTEHEGFAQMRGGDPFDEMVASASPAALLEQTQVDDYGLFCVFTTAYQPPGHSLQRLRTYGIFATFFSTKER